MPALTRDCLILNKKTGKKASGSFIIEAPITQDNGANYSCWCEIVGIPDSRWEVWGYDPIQAVELSMWHLQIHFETNCDYEFLYSDGTKMDSFTSKTI